MSDLREAIKRATPKATLLNEEIDAIMAAVEASLREEYERIRQRIEALPGNGRDQGLLAFRYDLVDRAAALEALGGSEAGGTDPWSDLMTSETDPGEPS